MATALERHAGVLKRVCELAADAVRQYVEISGEDPGDDMPEAFLSSSVFERVRTTATLETNIKKLFEWNRSQWARPSQNRATRSEAIAEISLPAILEKLNGRPRVDLVLFEGKALTKRHHRFLALVEFKRHRIDESDRDKLLAILEYIDACPLGAICSVVDATSESDWLISEKKRAEAAEDLWFAVDLPRLPHDVERRFACCLRAFSRR